MAFFKNISLTVKLLIAVLASSLLTFLVVFGIGYSLTNRVIYKDVEKIGSNLASSAVDKIEDISHEISRVTMGMQLLAQHGKKDEHDLFNVLKSTLERNRDIFGIAISYEPYLGDPKKKYFSPYCHRKERDFKCMMLGSSKYDYFEKAWYKSSKETGEAQWTDPYVEQLIINEPLLTYSEPFYKTIEGKQVLQGIVSADVSLEWLQNVISKSPEKYNGYPFLLSQEGSFITFPEEGFANTKNIKDFPEAQNVSEGMMGKLRGVEEFNDFVTGEKSWIFFEPVPLSDWSIGVVFKESELLSDIFYIANRMLILCILGSTVLCLVVFFISRRITRPLNSLAMVARTISHGKLDTQIPAMGRMDEVGNLARSFAKMQKDLKEHINELSRSISARAKISNELSIAHSIQQSIVPKNIPPMGKMGNVEAFGLLLPAQEIGGDLYDCFAIDEKHTCFVVGDVSDKGVHAAFTMAFVVTLLRGLSNNLKHPDHLLRIINDEIIKRINESMFVTLFCGILNNETGKLRFANAGHNPPVLLRSGKAPSFLKGDFGKALGIDFDAKFPWNSITLSKGDKIFSYTDGVTDAIDENESFFGEENLIEILKQSRETSPEQIVNAVIDEVRRHAGKCPLPDDIAMLCLSLTSCESKSLNIAVENDMKSIKEIADALNEFCKSFGCDIDFINELNLAIEETVVNIINFAYEDDERHEIEITIIKSGAVIEVTIMDDGRPFDPLKHTISDKGHSIKDMPLGGLGIILTKNMVDKAEYVRVGKYNKLKLIKIIGEGDDRKNRKNSK
ncbi:MAG: SpoIIE family protein phosphatase [Pseudomonadota bacterium]